MAKIALIDVAGWQGANEKGEPYPNIGIAYLFSSLSQAGHLPLIVDMNNENLTDQQLISVVAEFQADIIGLSIKTATMANARRIGRQIKQNFPNCPIVAGGPHVTVALIDLINEYWIDYLLQGECEESLSALCSLLDGKIRDLSGVVKCSEGVPMSGVCIGRISNLDNLTFPEYGSFGVKVKLSLQKSYPLITSRGCPYKCTYCSVAKISGNHVRTRSPENVLAELIHARNQFNIAGFEIVDDAFNVDMERAKKFCRLLIQSRMLLSWSCPNGIRADRIDAELASLMKNSGCSSVMVGIESADPVILKSVKKGETLEMIEQGIHLLQQSGMTVGGFFIIGLPGDSYSAQEASVEFARRNNIHAHFNMLVPYPGTDVYQWVSEHGKFLHAIEDGVHFADSAQKVMPVFETADFSAKDRLRAYEMVHTRLSAFRMLIPGNSINFRYKLQKLLLLIRYDRWQLMRLLKQLILGN